MICVDASVAGKWLFPEEYSAQADRLVRDAFEQREPVVAPTLLPTEVANIVRQRLRRGELKLDDARRLLAEFLALPITLQTSPATDDRALVLTESYGLPAYPLQLSGERGRPAPPAAEKASSAAARIEQFVGDMSMAAREGPGAGVTAVEINLKLIWDVITRIKIGETGSAFVVDSQGRLVSHPNISLVLQQTDLSSLPQIAQALSARGQSGPNSAQATTARDLVGRQVLTPHQTIESLGWLVFVEIPSDEAFAPLYASLVRTAA